MTGGGLPSPLGEVEPFSKRMAPTTSLATVREVPAASLQLARIGECQEEVLSLAARGPRKTMACCRHLSCPSNLTTTQQMLSLTRLTRTMITWSLTGNFRTGS